MATVLLLLALTIPADAETGSGWRTGLDPELAARLERDGIAVRADHGGMVEGMNLRLIPSAPT